MGKENDAMLDYLNNNYHFAALFNGCFFDGEEVVKAADLTEGSEGYVEKYPPADSFAGKTVPRIRDLKKNMVCGQDYGFWLWKGKTKSIISCHGAI